MNAAPLRLNRKRNEVVDFEAAYILKKFPDALRGLKEETGFVLCKKKVLICSTSRYLRSCAGQ